MSAAEGSIRVDESSFGASLCECSPSDAWIRFFKSIPMLISNCCSNKLPHFTVLKHHKYYLSVLEVRRLTSVSLG